VANTTKKPTPMNAVEDERFLKAVRDLEGESAHSIINNDPNKAYYLAAKDPMHPNSVERMKELGYEIVNQENNSGEIMPRGVTKNAEGGAIQTGQLVLMSMAKDVHNYRQRKLQEMTAERSAAINAELIEKIQESEGAYLSENPTNRKTFVMG
jgi:hypothetical protein